VIQPTSPAGAPVIDGAPPPESSTRSSAAFAIVTTLFFAWGFITSLIDPLVAAVKGIFSLSDLQAQLSASAFFIAYGIISFPAAALLGRLRSTRAVLLALMLMLGGCLTMLGAANAAVYSLVLLGLFILASGITILQVAANPLAVALGRPEGGHLRLVFSQAFNSLGTLIGPYLGAMLFLRGVEVKGGSVLTPEVRAGALAGIDRAFFWIAGLIALLTLFIYLTRKVINASAPVAEPGGPGPWMMFREALSSRWALLGGAAIFLYVGAEVAIGTQMALYLNSDQVLGLPLEQAGKMVSFYWGGAFVGRLLGSALLTRFRAPRLLATYAGVNALICLFVVSYSGAFAAYAALSMGLFNSIMFPLIFSITLERSSVREEATSGFLCFAIIGGAAFPPLVGLVSQHSSYASAFVVPALCYALVSGFALCAARARLSGRAPST
jgi:FHS family L-fucose permease-like MFS transporter